MSIHLLPEHVAVRIAAGEVVERPASVVKELVENSLDAGATRLEVETQEGGLRLIRVRDNGQGIPADEVELAFRRHATSKITTAEDLERILTLGFRGEALASIAAVARVTCTTRHRDAESGIRLRLEGGEILARSVIGYPIGTEMRIEDLFYNVPARRKFLSSPRSERKHCDAFLTRYAIAYPHIAFTLIHDGRTVLNTPGNGRTEEALVQVYGLDLARALLPIVPEADAEGLVRVRGYIGDTNTHRADRGYITLFVNGRWIHDLRLTYAVIQGYHTFLPVNRYPVAFILLDLPPEDIDVNVHPAKTEIRFRDPDAVFRLVQRAVRNTLLGLAPVAARWSPEDAAARVALRSQLASLTPARPFSTLEKESAVAPETPTLWEPDTPASSQSATRVPALLPGSLPQPDSPAPAEPVLRPESRPADVPLPVPPETPDSALAGATPGAASPWDAFGTPADSDVPIARRAPLPPKPLDEGGQPAPGAASPWDAFGAPADSDVPIARRGPLPPTPPEERLPALRMLGQVAATYIVAEGPDGLYLIDQHAAHERILYEALLEAWLAGHTEAQVLLEPAVVTLPMDEAAQLEALLPDLPAWGWEVELFGPNTFLVRAVPALFQNVPPALLLADLVASEELPLQGRKEELLARRICKRAAVKAGQSLTLAEMEALIQALGRTRSPRTCPHGRPILIHVSLDQLAHQFWRT